MSAFLVRLDASTGKTKYNNTNCMLVFADDEGAALEFAQAKYPGLTIWSEAQVIDLEAVETGDPEADPPVAPVEGVFAEFRLG